MTSFEFVFILYLLSFRHQRDVVMEHHYHIDIFLVVIDSRLRENEQKIQRKYDRIISFQIDFDLRDDYVLFRVDNICKLVNKFYLEDFTKQEKLHLKFQLELFELDVCQNFDLQKMSTISKLCQVLVKTRKLIIYPLVDRLICFALTLFFSTAIIERVFFVMKLIKTRLKNKMEDDFLASYMITYIKKDITQIFYYKFDYR